MKNPKIKTVLQANSYKATSYCRNHSVNMDRPNNEGGDNSAATPIEMLLSAIAGCVSMTLKFFADRNNLDLGEITVNVKQSSSLNAKGLVSTIVEEISFENSITDIERTMLLSAAKECPVVKMLKTKTNIKTNIL